MMNNTKSGGFTLIELLVVVLIIGILASVALPQYQKSVEKARAAEAITLVRAIADAGDAYFMANGEYPKDVRVLDIDVPGTVVTNYGYGAGAVKTKNFICRAASDSGYTNAVAYCNREPYHAFYGIGKLKTGELFCHGYNTTGIKICKTFGTKEVYVNSSTKGYAFN